VSTIKNDIKKKKTKPAIVLYQFVALVYAKCIHVNGMALSSSRNLAMAVYKKNSAQPIIKCK